jgi:hypothetical protein
LKGRKQVENNNDLMQQNEMTNAIAEIQVVQGSVVFGAYHDLKQQASELAEQIRTVDVNEENVKQSKKLLAEVNKRVKQLEDKRISIKKMMLEPYQDFEEQVKEIVGIVKDADAFVRSQVKELEEKERQEKEIQIHELFTKRIQHYSFREIVPFMDFAKPKHLNKSMSIQAVEKEMVDFFEKVESDLQVIYQMDDANDYINAYLYTYDLGKAMTIVKENKERNAQIERARQTTKAPSEVQKAFTFTVFNQKDATLIEMLMKQNNIQYEMKG